MDTNKKKSRLLRLEIAGVYLLYSLVAVVSKLAAGRELLSPAFLLLVAVVFVCFGVYALVWQQLIKRAELSVAYSYKGLTVIYALVWSALLFGEDVSVYNIAGALIILAGVYIAGRPEDE